MKKYLIFVISLFLAARSLAQTSTDKQNTTGTAANLAVPVSSAFSIVDITPTLVQNPATPKAFALGVAQSFQQGGTGFPDNYSANFTPVWWINPKGVNVYSYLGIDPPKSLKDVTAAASKENIFSGIKFATISVAFINKDLIPDTAKATQNIFSIGAHVTLIKVYGKSYAKTLGSKINEWEVAAQKELADNQLIQVQLLILDRKYKDKTDTNYKAARLKILSNYKESYTLPVFKSIDSLIAQKPIFTWDLSGAWAVYGLPNQQVQTGRAGVWTSFGLNLPLGKDHPDNYFNLNLIGRYLRDNFQQNDKGLITKADNENIGGNLGFDFNRLAIAVESLYRFTNGVANTQNRTVGVLSVKVADNIFINGTFGKDFAGPNKLISAFGLNWGLGKEKVALPVMTN